LGVTGGVGFGVGFGVGLGVIGGVGFGVGFGVGLGVIGGVGFGVGFGVGAGVGRHLASSVQDLHEDTEVRYDTKEEDKEKYQQSCLVSKKLVAEEKLLFERSHSPQQPFSTQAGHTVLQSGLQHWLLHGAGVGGGGVGAGVGRHLACVVHDVHESTEVRYDTQQPAPTQAGHTVAQSGLQHWLLQSSKNELEKVGSNATIGTRRSRAGAWRIVAWRGVAERRTRSQKLDPMRISHLQFWAFLSQNPNCSIAWQHWF
jgi:hypothetical protein